MKRAARCETSRCLHTVLCLCTMRSMPSSTPVPMGLQMCRGELRTRHQSSDDCMCPGRRSARMLLSGTNPCALANVPQAPYAVDTWMPSISPYGTANMLGPNVKSWWLSLLKPIAPSSTAPPDYHGVYYCYNHCSFHYYHYSCRYILTSFEFRNRIRNTRPDLQGGSHANT